MLQIQNKIEFENNCWVGLVDSSTFNSSEEYRIKAVTDIASITKGKLCFYNNPESFDYLVEIAYEVGKIPQVGDRRVALYNRLLTESAGKPSTPFEFIPLRTTDSHLSNYTDDLEDIEISNKILKYSILTEDDNSNDCKVYTNLRTILAVSNLKYQIFNTPKGVQDFKVIVGRVPMKVISHLRTHRAFSWLVESSRNKKYLNNVEFWYPSWWNMFTILEFKQRDIDTVLRMSSDYIASYQIKPEEATMELSDRRLVHFAMAAWKQDTNAWDNLFAVRGNKTGTMSITGMTVDNIKQLIKQKKN